MARIPGGKLIRQRNFLLSFVAAVINRFGDSVDLIAMSWLVYQVSGSASVSALNFAVNYIPTVFLQPFCGAMVEKKNHRRLIAVCDFGRAIIVAAVAVIYAAGRLSSPIVLVGTFMISLLEAFRQPAHTAFIPEFLDREDYSDGLSLTASAQNVVQIFGSAAAGVILAAFGVAFAIFVDAACFALSGILIARIRVRRGAAAEAAMAEAEYAGGKAVYAGAEASNGGQGREDAVSADSTLQGFREGLAYVRGSRILLFVSMSALAVNIMTVPFMSFQAAICEEIFRRGPEVLSVVNVTMSIGVVIGSLLYPSFKKKVQPCRILALCCLTIGSFYLVIPVMEKVSGNPVLFWPVISVLPFILGIMMGVINVFFSVFLLEHTPESYLSRVSALFYAICMAGQPAGALVISALVAVLGLKTLLILIGVYCLALCGFFLLGRATRELDRSMVTAVSAE